MAIESSGGGALQRQQETSSLADVVGTILDKGVVVDVFARVSLVGIELLRVDARIVIASVDTYLQFAEAANRLELGTQEPEQLSDVASDITESGAKAGASRIAEGKAKGFLDNLLSPTEEDEKARSRDD
ncbi:MAG: gas vesicle protein [Solirubrobacterales bacterium]|nr:gas vesicle protein [Solirubrobacterales bacterium]